MPPPSILKITYSGKSETNVKNRIAQAKQTFYKKKHLFMTNNVGLKTRKTYKKFCMLSIVSSYGAETWMILKAEKNESKDLKCGAEEEH